MRPQQKPFVVEIKKTRRRGSKPKGEGRASLTAPKTISAVANQALQREERA
jgi:RNA 3'-terminal phosphate cyclase